MIYRSLVTIVTCLALAGALRVRRADDDDDDGPLNLTPDNQTKTCKTKDGRDGMCIHESACTEDHVFQPGGIIDDSEIRRRVGNCPGMWDWCCVFPNMTSSTNVTTSTEKIDRTVPALECQNAAKDSCPWCVGLYRDGGHPHTKSPTGLFCGGAVIGFRTVLTSASCVLAAKGNVWVQIPGSDKHYAVSKTVKNTQFNSGTREQDTALLTLNEDISWPDQKTGACLGLRTPLLGDCVAVGFDKKDQIVFTPLAVTTGGCSEQGSTIDAACGRAGGFCSVTLGSPVLCPSDGQGLIVAGVVRQACQSEAVLLGSLLSSADWIREQLTNSSIAANFYTHYVPLI